MRMNIVFRRVSIRQKYIIFTVTYMCVHGLPTWVYQKYFFFSPEHKYIMLKTKFRREIMFIILLIYFKLPTHIILNMLSMRSC